MKILEEGKLPENKAPVYRGRCTNCRCLVEMEEEEAAAKKYNVICPTIGCSYVIVVNRKIYRELPDVDSRDEE